MMLHENNFTKEATTRPLFQALSEQHARPYEWSGPLGFVLGGFARSAMQAERDGALAEQYINTATALIDDILDHRVADYTVANGALFLYRHCFELLLKVGLPPQVRVKKDIHSPGKLVRCYAHHRKEAGETIPSWVIRRCDEPAAVDPGSEAFRYGGYGLLKAKDGTPIIDEGHVDLVHLRAAMLALNTALILQNWLNRMVREDRP